MGPRWAPGVESVRTPRIDVRGLDVRGVPGADTQWRSRMRASVSATEHEALAPDEAGASGPPRARCPLYEGSACDC
jgi:hypothetical protein